MAQLDSLLANLRLARTLDHAGIGIVETDSEGRLLRVNAGLCEMMGLTEAELLGRPFFDATHPEDVERDRALYRQQVAGALDRYSIEKRIARRDGGYFWASITSSSVRDTDGRFLYAVRVQHDITDRKHAEEMLARRIEEQAALYELSKELQRALSAGAVHEAALDAICRALRCARASILLLDAKGAMRFVAWRGLSDGYRKAVDGHSPWTSDALHPEPFFYADLDAADLPADLKATIAGEGIGALAFIPLVQNGRLLGKFMVYFDRRHDFQQAELDVAMAIARQLAFAVERMRAEEARQRGMHAALQLAAIVESSDDAIASKDLDGVVTSWNKGAERIFGYTAAEMIGRPIATLIPQDRQDEEPEILRRIRSGERIDHYETARRRKDGRLIDVALTVSPMHDESGRVIGASKIARDITERKNAEARLAASERKLQELLAAIPAAIYTTDANGRITYYNEAAVELAGRRPTIGSDEWCVTWKLYWPDGRPMRHDECPMAVALKEGRAIRNAEAIAERPDGTRVPFIPYPTPLRDESGKVVGAINMLVDISERKQAESQQRMLLNELNHRVKNNMQLLQSLLSSAARETTSAEAKTVLREAGDRLSAMAAAQRVLYSSADATRFQAGAFLDAVCATMRHTLPANVRIDNAAEPGALSNEAAMPLALILNELLTNAVKHGLGGGPGTVRASLTREGDGFVLAVEDDGPGFDLEAVRPHASGLRLVDGLTRQLRGRFEVTRDPVSRCSVRFP
ncbi:MAG TPA: PAS domain S-box protein [Dongiaceae bacterium]|nr:PAS domain S-box protein [Dongiaceae bacterium]